MGRGREEVKMETPFTGQLAVLGVQGRLPHVLRLDGNWELKPGAVVVHQTRIGELEFGGATVIGVVERLEVKPHMEHGHVLLGSGLGVSWLAHLLDEGSHALSMEMDLMTRRAHHEIVSGRVVGALLVRADAYGWAGA